MATGGGQDEGGWWEGWIQAAKQKSAVALEQVKRDLGEFSSTIQRDTSSAVVSSAGVIKDSLQTEPNESSTSSLVKKGFSDLLSGLSESLAPRNPSEEETTHQAVSSKTSHHIFDRAKARLHSMQIDAGTYCADPDGPAHVYEDWLLSFDMDDYKGDISDLLVSNTDVRAIYTKLVPAVVSNADFWGRYFYKMHQLHRDEARRTALKERAEMTSSQTFDIEELQWDEDEVSEDSSVTVDSLESRHTSRRPQDCGDRVSEPAGSRVADDRRVTPEPSADEEDAQVGTTATETPPERPCQHRRLSAEPEPGPADHEGTITTAGASTSEQEEDTGNRCRGRTRKDLDTPRDDTANNQEEGTRNKEPSEQPDQSKGRERSEDRKASHSKDSRSPDAGALMVQVPIPTEDTQLDQQIEKKISPSGSDASNKDSSLSDDWEKDFDDIDVSDEDLAGASSTPTKTRPSDDIEDDDLDDWENWE